MNPGDIVLIRFPQADLQAGKLRPALVIGAAPGRHADLLLALIPSQIQQVVPEFDEVIEHTDSDYAETGSKVRSAVRIARLASVESDVINARLGSISPARLEKIKKRLVEWLAKLRIVCISILQRVGERVWVRAVDGVGGRGGMIASRWESGQMDARVLSVYPLYVSVGEGWTGWGWRRME